MSRVCQVTGKKPMVGNNVSHSNRKTKRRYLLNLHTKNFEYEENGCKKSVTLRLSNHGLRIVDKLGIIKVLEKIRARGERV